MLAIRLTEKERTVRIQIWPPPQDGKGSKSLGTKQRHSALRFVIEESLQHSLLIRLIRLILLCLTLAACLCCLVAVVVPFLPLPLMATDLSQLFRIFTLPLANWIMPSTVSSLFECATFQISLQAILISCGLPTACLQSSDLDLTWNWKLATKALVQVPLARRSLQSTNTIHSYDILCKMTVDHIQYVLQPAYASFPQTLFLGGRSDRGRIPRRHEVDLECFATVWFSIAWKSSCGGSKVLEDACGRSSISQELHFCRSCDSRVCLQDDSFLLSLQSHWLLIRLLASLLGVCKGWFMLRKSVFLCCGGTCSAFWDCEGSTSHLCLPENIASTSCPVPCPGDRGANYIVVPNMHAWQCKLWRSRGISNLKWTENNDKSSLEYLSLLLFEDAKCNFKLRLRIKPGSPMSLCWPVLCTLNLNIIAPPPYLLRTYMYTTCHMRFTAYRKDASLSATTFWPLQQAVCQIRLIIHKVNRLGLIY